MNIKIFLRNRFKIFSRVNDSEHSSRESRAVLHWKIIAIVFLLGVIAVFASSFLMYRDIERGELSQAVAKSATDPYPITAELLGKTVKNFEAKASLFKQVQNNRTVLVDPSR